jgi:hypothetical protein
MSALLLDGEVLDPAARFPLGEVMFFWAVYSTSWWQIRERRPPLGTRRHGAKGS